MNRKQKQGFSMVEIVIAIVIGAVLTTMMVRSFNTSSWGIAARQAREAFVSLHAKARAHAIERGETVRLNMDEAGDSVWLTAGADQIDVYRFGEELNVELGASIGTPGFICFSPRGIADPDCSTSDQTVTVTFTRGAETESIRILPLGQIRR